jgi:hypothetical protein
MVPSFRRYYTTAVKNAIRRTDTNEEGPAAQARLDFPHEPDVQHVVQVDIGQEG